MDNEEYNPEHLDETSPTYPLLSDKQYVVLKRFVTLLLPAFGTFYATLAGSWGWPAQEQVVTTTLAVATFGGVFLAFAGRAYDKAIATGTVER